MDSITRSKLIALLKSNKLLPKFEKEVEKMRVKRDSYFDWVESIYAISRIIPNAGDDNLRHKLTEVNKVWVRMVITDDLCPQLRPYFDKYGQEAVYNAVSYLLEKNAWVSPVDDKGLKAKMPSNYDGLLDIDETVAMLKEEEEFRKGKKATQPAPAENKEQDPTPVEAQEMESGFKGLQFDLEALKAQKTAYDEASAAYSELGEMLARAQVLHTAFGSLTKQEELLTMFEQENKRLEQELAEHKNMVHAMKRMKDETDEKWRNEIAGRNEEYRTHKEQLKKELNDAKSTTETLRRELERERRLHKEDNDKAYQNRLAKEKAERELAELATEHANTEADLAELRRLAKEASEMPSAKIIPMEDLDTLYGMGAKMKSVLLPFLEKHGIRFLTEDERKKLKRSPR